MTTKKLLGLLAAGGLAAVISCDDGSAGTVDGLAVGDCPLGTFKPPGLDECVFPGTDLFSQPVAVSDNRCSVGQPAVPPTCVSDSGGRAYLTISTKCAPGYRYLPGACNRQDNSGAAGFFNPVGAAGTTGSAGATGGDGGPGGVGAAGDGPGGDPGTGVGTGTGTGVGGDGGGGGGSFCGGVAGCV